MDVSRIAVTAMAVLCSLVICNVRSADDGDAENNPPITQPDDDPTIPKNEAGEFPENGCSVHQWSSWLDTKYSKPCADDGGLQVPQSGKVRKLEITVPVGSAFEFSTLIAKSKIGYAAIYSECTKCGWWKREYRRHTRGSFPITKSFPETGEHTASVISKCRLQTVGSLGGQSITYGCGKDFTLDYTVHAIGVEEMKYSPEDGKSVYRDNLDLYIRGKMPDSSRPGTEITFTPSPSGGSNWPRETPDGLGEYKLPAWSMTNEVDYDESRPDSPYRLSGAFMHARKYSGDASLTYKANAVGTHIITASCGSAPPDEHGMSVPLTLEGDIAHKSYQLHVCAPQISVKFIHPKSDGCKVFYMARSYYMRKLIPFELTARANGIPESFEPQIFRQDGNFSFYRTKGRYYEFVPEPVRPSSPNTSGIWHEMFAIWVVEPPLTESESHISIRGTYGIDGTDIMDEDDDNITVKWYDPFNDDDPNNPRKLPQNDPNYEPPIDYHTPVDNPDWIPIPDDPELPPLPPVEPGTGGGDPAPPSRPTPPGPPHTHDFVKTIACSYNYQNPDQVHLFTGNTVQELETLLTHAPQGTDDSCYFVKTCKGCGYSYQGPVHTHSASQMTYYICPRCDEQAEYFFTANKRRFHIRAACPCCAAKDDSELIWVNVDDDIILFIDSDNNNNFNLPDCSLYEKNIDRTTNTTGKIIPVNNLDSDYDGVPDYCSYIPQDESRNPIGTSAPFVPIVLCIPDSISDNATVQFAYSFSNPQRVNKTVVQVALKPAYEYTLPAEGHLRLWLKNGTEPRSYSSISSSSTGDLIPTGSTISVTKIRERASIFPGDNEKYILYVEAVKASQAVGEQTIIVNIVDGENVIQDQVHCTIVDVKEVTPKGETKKVMIYTDESLDNESERYYIPEQTEDGKVLVTAKLSLPLANVPVYFEVIDPDDLSPYEGKYMEKDKENGNIDVKGKIDYNLNDNYDPSKSMKSEEGDIIYEIFQNNCLSERVVYTDEQGIARTTLIITDQYSGDNYIVRATCSKPGANGFDTNTAAIDPIPAYTLTSIKESAMLVAWKRTYLEYYKTYKNGVTVHEASIGSSTIYIKNKSISLNYHNAKHAIIINAPNNIISLPITSVDELQITLANPLTFKIQNDTHIIFDNNSEVYSIDFSKIEEAFGCNADGSDGGAFIEFKIIPAGIMPWLAGQEPSFALQWFTHNNKNVIQMIAAEYILLPDLRKGTGVTIGTNSQIFLGCIFFEGFYASEWLRKRTPIHEIGHAWGILLGKRNDLDHIDLYVKTQDITGQNDYYCTMAYVERYPLPKGYRFCLDCLMIMRKAQNILPQ